MSRTWLPLSSVLLLHLLCGLHSSSSNGHSGVIVEQESSFLPSDCWEKCYEFLASSIDCGHFRLISTQHHALCRSLFRRKFSLFHTICTQRTQQQRIRSWSDIEVKIPFNPSMHISWQWTNDSAHAFLSLFLFHLRSIQPIVCGVSHRGIPFVSFYLEDVHHGNMTILVSLLTRNGSRIDKTLIFDQFHPLSLRFDSFGIAEFDQLLDGQTMELRHPNGYLSRHLWHLMTPREKEADDITNWFIVLFVFLSITTGSIIVLFVTVII